MVGQISRTWEGRAEDLMILDIGQPVPGTTVLDRQRVTQSSIAGIQSCCQTFALLLLTRRGTASNSTLGTDLLTAVQQQLVRTESDLRNQFALAVSQVVPQVNSQSVNPDERVASALLEGALVERQRITLRIRLTTEAGSNATFLAPIERYP